MTDTTIKKKRSGNKIYFIIGGILLLFVIVMIAFSGGSSELKVAVEEAEERMIIETVTANGKIYPKNEITISPQIRGEIMKVFVEEGDSVVEGQKLIQIDAEVYQSQLDQAMAQLNQVKANLAQMRAMNAQAQAQFEVAELTYNRQQKLYKAEVISDMELEQAVSSYKTAMANLESSKQNVAAAGYQVESANANVRQSQKNLSWTTIFAPVNGVVSQLMVKQGERVIGNEMTSGTELLKIADLNNMEAHVDVGENDILRVKELDVCWIEVDAHLNRAFEGQVTQIANSANNLGSGLGGNTEVTNFQVKVRILPKSYQDIIQGSKGGYPFRPGMNTTVDIQTERKEGILSIPIQSVTTRESADSTDKEGQAIEEEVVFIVEEGAVKAVEVKTGIQDDQFIEILEGVEVGDKIVMAPFSAISRKLKDGMKVVTVDEKELYNLDGKAKE